MGRIRSALLVLTGLAGMSIASCSMSSTDPIVGTWNLSTYNGNVLPYLGLNSETFVFTGGGTWTASQSTTTGSSTGYGTWSVSGSTYSVVLVSPSGPPGTATISGTTLTILETGNTLVFQKQ